MAHTVYVVELDAAVKRSRRVQRKNPHAAKGKPAVYVGLTGQSPAQRLAAHQAGHRASRTVRKHGQRLRPDLAGSTKSSRTHDEGKKAEARLAEQLRRQGYTVLGGT